MAEKKRRSSRKKLRDTQGLVKIALREGMTQKEIAKLCRTQQSVVSEWKNGNRLGTEQQLDPLLREYGSLLNRTSSRIYLIEREVPDGTTFALPTDVARHEDDHRSAFRERWLARNSLVRVHGPIVFRHAMRRPVRRSGRTEHEVFARWLVHRTGPDQLALIRQRRRALSGYDSRRRSESISAAGYREKDPSPWLISPADEARWLSAIEGPFTVEELIAWADDYFARGSDPALAMVDDELTVPFLLRARLAEHGFRVPGLTEWGDDAASDDVDS